MGRAVTRLSLALFALVLAACGTVNAPLPGASMPAAEGVVDLAADGSPVVAHWRPVGASGAPRPAVIALHGCGGLYRRDGTTFDTRYPSYVERLHRAGYHVLLPDSFTPRGTKEICTVPSAQRTIKVETRRADVIAAVRWLARQPDVDPKRIAILGWSHGAMTTLSAINAARAAHATPLAGAVVFYPGCNELLSVPFRLDIPVLMLLAEKDDWTPPARCTTLAERTRARQPDIDLTVHVYPDSYHGFDGTTPVRLLERVPNGINPAGVHAGANPAAGAQAQAEMDRFFSRVLR